MTNTEDPNERVEVSIRVSRKSLSWVTTFLENYVSEHERGAAVEADEFVSQLWPYAATDDCADDSR